MLIFRSAEGALYVNRIMMYQVVAAAVCAFIAYFYKGDAAAGAAWLGGLAALLNTAMLTWRMRGADRRQVREPGRELTGIIRSSMERFFMVSLLLAAGLGWLKLMPLPLLAGFAVGQMTLVVSTIISGTEKQ